MKKSQKKKILLYLSFIPYGIFLLMCISNIIFGYGDIENILNDLENAIVRWDTLIILVLCFGYQMYYLINIWTAKGDKIDEVDTTEKNKRVKVSKVLYNISLACWGIYLLLSVCCIPIVGEFFGESQWPIELSIENMLGTLLWNATILIVIPILPITAIYIIGYLISNRKK